MATPGPTTGAASAIWAAGRGGRGGDGNKLAHDIAMSFKANTAKFSGDIGESWIKFVATYYQVSRDYDPTPRHRLQFRHNLLRRDAKRFYLDAVNNFENIFQQAVSMIEAE